MEKAFADIIATESADARGADQTAAQHQVGGEGIDKAITNDITAPNKPRTIATVALEQVDAAPATALKNRFPGGVDAHS
jgi:hypothetical protein